MVLPFVAMLLSLAVMPLLAPDWWHRHYAKVSVGLAAITAGYYVLVLGNGARVMHVAHEYASFIALIGSLFVVAAESTLMCTGRRSRG
jgi:hypothetical protein